jgi:pSer/pThr/pTyr-binding forkhead associated (FHA) protein
MPTIIQLHDNVAIRKFPVDKPSLAIGRHPDNDVCIDDKVVSTKHALIELVEEKGSQQYYIKDLESTNGTYLNGKKITREKLNHDDLIRIGLNSLKFVDEDTLKADETLRIRKSWIPGVYYTKE